MILKNRCCAWYRRFWSAHVWQGAPVGFMKRSKVSEEEGIGTGKTTGYSGRCFLHIFLWSVIWHFFPGNRGAGRRSVLYCLRPGEVHFGCMLILLKISSCFFRLVRFFRSCFTGSGAAGAVYWPGLRAPVRSSSCSILPREDICSWMMWWQIQPGRLSAGWHGGALTGWEEDFAWNKADMFCNLWYTPEFDTCKLKKSLQTLYLWAWAAFLICADMCYIIIWQIFCVFYNGSHSGFRNEFQICTEIEMIVQIVR